MTLGIVAAAAVASSTSNTATSAAFTPVATETLAVLATAGANSSTAVTIAVTDSQGGTWIQKIQANLTAPGGSGGGAVTGIWTRANPAASSMTITVTATGGTVNASGFRPYRLSGNSITFGTGTRGASASNPMNPTAFTSTVPNSSMLVAASEWSGGGTLTSSDLTFSTFSNGNMEGGWGFKLLDGTTGSETFNMGGGALWYWAAIEVWDATPAAAGTVVATAATAGTITATMLAAGTTAATAAGTSGTITSRLLVPGIVASTSTATGAIIKTPPQIDGTAAAAASLSGDVIVKVGLLGTVVSASTATGTLGPFRLALAGTAAASAAGTSGAITSRLLVSGTAAALSSVSGGVGPVRLALSGTVAATSTAAGGARSILGVSGTVVAATSLSGSLLVSGKPGQGAQVLVLFNPDEVLTGGRVTYYQFDLLDPGENLIGQLRGVAGGDISIDAYSAVKATGKLTVATDPAFSRLRDNQPDFLGVQINAPLGPSATATAATGAPADRFLCADAGAGSISVGDRVIVTDSASQPKDGNAYTVRFKTSSAGTTTVFFTTSAGFGVAIGDLLKVVTVSFEQRVDWLNARIRPMIRIARLGGGDDPLGTLVPVGVFLCAAPVEQWEVTGLTRQVELADKLSILDQDIASGDPSGIAAYALDTGTNIINTVKALIAETGEVAPAIAPDAKVLASPMVWEIGATRLKVVNDLLDAAGYFSLYCDGQGQYQATPYVQPADRVPVYSSIAPFSSGPQSLMDPSWTRDRDIYSIPNRYLLVGQGNGTNPALTSLATNVDPDSPYSFPSRGRWVTVTEVGVEAASQAELDTLARARLSRATSVTNQLTVKHAFLPDLHVNSVIRFVNPDSGLDTYCYVVNTTITFDPTALCQTVMRLVA